MKNYEIKAVLDKIAPLNTQAEWDNSGIQICFGKREIKTVLVALEITDEVITEAENKKVDMIITHHPLIFEPIKSLHVCDPRGRYVERLVKDGIVVYSSHTPFDICKGGNTDYLMKLMGVKNVKAFEGTDGFVKVGKLSKATTLSQFAYDIANKLSLDGLKFAGDPDKKVLTVACCTGAGGEFWFDVKEDVDVYVTGDVKHHEAQYASDAGIGLIDAGHWGTEKFFVENMAAKLAEPLKGKVKIIKSEVNQDPFSYME